MPLGGASSRRFYMRCTLVSAAGMVLCLATALVLLALQSPRFDMGQPWMDKALGILKALLLFFSLSTIVLKFFVQISDGPGDSSE